LIYRDVLKNGFIDEFITGCDLYFGSADLWTVYLLTDLELCFMEMDGFVDKFI
jgi:hypothetical protein